MIPGISLSPRHQRLGLYYLLFYNNVGQEEFCLFLRELLRRLPGPLQRNSHSGFIYGGPAKPVGDFQNNPGCRPGMAKPKCS